MQSQPSSQDTHDESYFASFTDMLVGIIFIFIILLMIFANNYQEATESVTRTSRELEEARNKALQEEIQKLREQASSKALDEAREKEIAEMKALVDAKSMEANTKSYEAEMALARANALEQQVRALQASNSLKQESNPVQTTLVFQSPLPSQEPKVTDDVITKQMTATRQNQFNDSRTEILKKIQEALTMQGVTSTADTNSGALLIPENALFNPNQGTISHTGKQATRALSEVLKKYLPCISPTKNKTLMGGCNELNLPPNTGLDAIFIDDYPSINRSKEDRLLLAVERTVSIVNDLKNNEPYLYRDLKNITGAPILNIKVNQERRKAWSQEENNPVVKGYVVMRFIMRKPNKQDLQSMRQ